jgi:hypothetical protein
MARKKITGPSGSERVNGNGKETEDSPNQHRMMEELRPHRLPKKWLKKKELT